MSCYDSVSQGQLVIDWQSVLGRGPNATIIEKIDGQKFKKLLFDSLL